MTKAHKDGFNPKKPNPDAGHSTDSKPKVYFPNSNPASVATARQTVDIFLATSTAW